MICHDEIVMDGLKIFLFPFMVSELICPGDHFPTQGKSEPHFPLEDSDQSFLELRKSIKVSKILFSSTNCYIPRIGGQ